MKEVYKIRTRFPGKDLETWDCPIKARMYCHLILVASFATDLVLSYDSNYKKSYITYFIFVNNNLSYMCFWREVTSLYTKWRKLPSVLCFLLHIYVCCLYFFRFPVTCIVPACSFDRGNNNLGKTYQFFVFLLHN